MQFSFLIEVSQFPKENLASALYILMCTNCTMYTAVHCIVTCTIQYLISACNSVTHTQGQFTIQCSLSTILCTKSCHPTHHPDWWSWEPPPACPRPSPPSCPWCPRRSSCLQCGWSGTAQVTAQHRPRLHYHRIVQQQQQLGRCELWAAVCAECW